MKKLIILLGILSIFCSTIFAQINVELHRVTALENYSIVSLINQGNVFYVQTEPFDDSKFCFTIKNLGSENTTFKIRKTQLMLANPGEGAADICSPNTIVSGFGQCSSAIETMSFIMQPNETAVTYLRYYHGENSGTSNIELTLYTGTSWENAAEINKFSFKIIFTTDPISSQITKIPTFSIFPNPASTSFTVNANFTENTCIEVYNITGKQVLKAAPKSCCSYVVDCSKWEKGYYFCRLITDEKIIKTLKIVVTR